MQMLHLSAGWESLQSKEHVEIIVQGSSRDKKNDKERCSILIINDSANPVAKETKIQGYIYIYPLSK